MSTTSHFHFAIFGSTGNASYKPSEELARFTTLDRNLGTLIQMVGEGVLGGILPSVAPESNVVVFSAGGLFVGGLVGSVADETTYVLDYTAPVGETVDVYIYAEVEDNAPPGNSTYRSGIVGLEAGDTIPDNAVGLVKVRIDEHGYCVAFDESDTTRVHYNDTYYNRPTVGLTSDVLALLLQHHHTGKDGNPTKINLASEVYGKLPAANIDGDIPASKISGSIKIDSIILSHSELRDIGVYTHPQLDEIYTFLKDALKVKSWEKYGAVQIANSLKSTLTLMRRESSTLPSYRLLNERPIIPGITPDAWIDFSRTTALVDTDEHTVTGTKGEALPEGQQTAVTATWDRILDIPGGDTANLTTEVFGFAGSTQIPFPATDNVQILQQGVSAAVQLAEESHLDRYLPTGTFYVRVESPVPVTWNTVAWTVGPDTVNGEDGSATFNVEYKTTNSGIPSSPIGMGGWTPDGGATASPITVATGVKTRYLWVKCNFTASADLQVTPLLTQLAVTYDPSTDAKCSFLIYAASVDWLRDLISQDPDILIADDACGNGSVTLKNHPIYLAKATFISPVVDSGDTYVWWNTLYLSTYIPNDDTLPVAGQLYVKVYVRSTADYSVAAPTGWGNDWQSTTGWEQVPVSERIPISAKYAGGIITETGRHERYLQVKIELYASASLRSTPEVLGLSATYFTEAPEDTSKTHILHFAHSGNDLDSWGAPGTNLALGDPEANLTTEVFNGAITIADTTKGNGTWVSPPMHITDHQFIAWDKITLNGEDIQNSHFRLQFSDDGITWDDEVVAETTTPYIYKPTTGISPFIVDLADPPSPNGDGGLMGAPNTVYAGGPILPGSDNTVVIAGVLETNSDYWIHQDMGTTVSGWDKHTVDNSANGTSTFRKLNKNFAFLANKLGVYMGKTTGDILAGSVTMDYHPYDEAVYTPISDAFVPNADIDFGDSNIGIITGGNCLLRTTDGGDTWTYMSGGTSDGASYSNWEADILIYSVDMYDATYGVCGGNGGTSLGGYPEGKFFLNETKDGGATWTPIPPPPDTMYAWWDDSTTYPAVKKVTMMDENNIIVSTEAGSFQSGDTAPGGTNYILFRVSRTTPSDTWVWTNIGLLTSRDAILTSNAHCMDYTRETPRMWVCGPQFNLAYTHSSDYSVFAAYLAYSDDLGVTWTVIDIQDYVLDLSVNSYDYVYPQTIAFSGDRGIIFLGNPLLGKHSVYLITQDAGVTFEKKDFGETMDINSATFMDGDGDTEIITENRTRRWMRILLELEN